MKPVPDNFQSFLNISQLITLRDAEKRGWELYFLRHKDLDVPVPVVRRSVDKTIGVIEEGGRLNTTSNISIRVNPERIAIPDKYFRITVVVVAEILRLSAFAYVLPLLIDESNVF